MRRAAPIIIAILLAACAAQGAPSAVAPSVATPAPATPSPTPVASPMPEVSGQPAIAGTDVNQVLDLLVDHDLACERDGPGIGPDPPPELLGAVCTGATSGGGSDLIVFVNYWPDGGILSVEGQCCSQNPAPDRQAWLHWFATIPYEGADPATVEAWLLTDTRDGCGLGERGEGFNCHLTVGAASWFHQGGNGYGVAGLRYLPPVQ